MRREAESHADEDKVRKEEVETRNKADQAVYAAELMIKDTGDKLTEADKQLLEQAVAEVKKASDGGDVGALASALEALTVAQQKAGEAIYAQSAQGAPDTGGQDVGDDQDQGASGSDGEVIDAEVVEEDKK